MRCLLSVLLALSILLPCTAMALDQLDVDPQKYVNQTGFLGYVPDRFIVVLKDEVAVDHSKDLSTNLALSDKNGFAQLAQSQGVYLSRPQFIGADLKPDQEKLARHYKIFLEGDNLEEAIAAYEAHPLVERVEKIGVHTVYAAPNDPYYDDNPGGYAYDQWHYFDTYGMRANTAWDIEAGDAAVLVGDLDIGTKYDHGDLGGSNPPGPNDASTNGNIWVNSNETPGNGIDDDGNGYIDDIIGWDFVERTDWYSYQCIDADCGGADNDPSDGDGHGTHTAGTIAAITNNGYAVAGVAGGYGDGTFSGTANGVKIVPCRIGYVLDYSFYGATGVVIMDYVAEAMYYMGNLKAAGWNVAAINCSFGTSNSGGLGSAADYLISQDVVICVAAGNSSSSSPDYLGSRGDCLDVAATDKSGNNASFTNYGSWVDIAAPGVEVLSTITDPADPTGDYVAPLDGTSMACPHVAGVVGLLESFNPALTAAEKIAIIKDPANTNPYGGSRDLGAGIIDAKKCLDAAGPNTNPPVAQFTGSPTSGEYPLAVSFTDQSTNTPTSWSWDFGDGVGTSSQQNPSYTYNNAGTYTVSLTATNAYGSDIETKVDYITVTEPGTGAEAYAQSDYPVSGTVSGTYLATHTSDNSRQSIQELESGGRPTLRHTYLEHKWTFNVPSSASLTFYVEGYRNANSENDNFTFAYSTNDNSYTNLVTIASSTEQIYSATIPNSVSGTVYIRVVDTDRSQGNRSKDYVYIDHMYIQYSSGTTPPVADFSASPTSGDYPLTVNFTDLSTGSPTSWSWDFGDGVGTSTSQNPSYTYNAAGTYTVSLTATNAYGSDIETKVDYITVTQPPQNPPVADFVGSPTSGDYPLTVNFTDQSTNSPTSWSWDFGDGVGTSTAQNPSYTYNAAGTYTVSLTATNAYGSDSETKLDYITVTEPTQNNMHVSNMTVNRRTRGPLLNGDAYVTVVDQNGSPVANATVSGYFNFPNTSTKSGLTGSDGVAFIEGDKEKSSYSDICFEVTNVTHTTNTYDPNANAVTKACESGWVYGESSGELASVDNNLPREFGLSQNYPNPFNPVTEISFSLPGDSHARLEVYNIMGQRIAVLADGHYGAGRHFVTWDASGVSSGIYLYRLTTDFGKETKRMTLLK